MTTNHGTRALRALALVVAVSALHFGCMAHEESAKSGAAAPPGRRRDRRRELIPRPREMSYSRAGSPWALHRSKYVRPPRTGSE